MTMTYIQPEDFQNFRFVNHSTKMKQTGMCTLVLGIIIVIIVYTMMNYSCKSKQFVSGYISQISQGISSKFSMLHEKISNASVSSKQVQLNKSDAYTVDMTNKDVWNLTACSSDDSSCNDYKKGIDDNLKNMYAQKLKTFVEENPKSTFMIYAPWCPHCHTAMPNFCDASKECEEKFALVNAELIPSNMLHEEPFKVSHFPYICKLDNMSVSVFQGDPTAKNIISFSKSKSEDSPQSAEDHLQMMFM